MTTPKKNSKSSSIKVCCKLKRNQPVNCLTRVACKVSWRPSCFRRSRFNWCRLIRFKRRCSKFTNRYPKLHSTFYSSFLFCSSLCFRSSCCTLLLLFCAWFCTNYRPMKCSTHWPSGNEIFQLKTAYICFWWGLPLAWLGAQEWSVTQSHATKWSLTTL